MTATCLFTLTAHTTIVILSCVRACWWYRTNRTHMWFGIKYIYFFLFPFEKTRTKHHHITHCFHLCNRIIFHLRFFFSIPLLRLFCSTHSFTNLLLSLLRFRPFIFLQTWAERTYSRYVSTRITHLLVFTKSYASDCRPKNQITSLFLLLLPISYFFSFFSLFSHGSELWLLYQHQHYSSHNEYEIWNFWNVAVVAVFPTTFLSFPLWRLVVVSICFSVGRVFYFVYLCASSDSASFAKPFFFQQIFK